MQSSQDITRISVLSRYGLLMAMALMLVAPAVLWFTDLASGTHVQPAAMQWLKDTPLTMPKRLLGWAISMLPASVVVVALWQLRKAFGEYAKGRVFSMDAINALHGAGMAGLALVLVKGLVPPLMSVAMTYDFPKGQRMLSIGIGFTAGGLLAFFAALMFLVVAWVMREARANAEDLAQIV